MHTLVPARVNSTRGYTALPDIPPTEAGKYPEIDRPEPWHLMSHEPQSTVFWELTPMIDGKSNASGLRGRTSRSFKTLSTFDSYKLIDQIAALSPDELVLTGGDPLGRDDCYELIRYARRRLLDPALAVTPGMRLTYASIAEHKQSGLTRLIFDIDGSLPSLHDAIHDVSGGFGATTRAMRWARTMGLSIEVNTLITRLNAKDLAAIADLIRQFSIERWNTYFPVPVESNRPDGLTANETESAFASIYAISQSSAFAVRTVEAPHYRRFLLQRAFESRPTGETWTDFAGFEAEEEGLLAKAVQAALAGPNGYVFISHNGDVRASQFLPLSAGNVRHRPLPAIYRDAPLFEMLRDPSNLKGKCGRCEFKALCGGSRARALATVRDLFATDPLCAYQPGSASAAKGQALSIA